MAILDKFLVFSDGQLITGDAISDVVDRGATAPVTANFGGGFAGDLFLVVQTGAALAAGTSLDIKLASDSTANLATSPTIHWASGHLPAADLTANKVLAIVPMPPGEYERYVGMIYDATGTFNAGSIRAFLTTTPNYWRAMVANNPIAN